MEQLIFKYANKLTEFGLACKDDIVLAGRDAEIFWSRQDLLNPVFEKVFDGLNINSFLYGKPKEPLRSIIEYLTSTTAVGSIYPMDTETRTYLHDIPIGKEPTANNIIKQLKKRKSVLLNGGAIATTGTVSPEEAYVTFSSVCFACYVKFMVDCLKKIRTGSLDNKAKFILNKAVSELVFPSTCIKEISCNIASGPFTTDESAHLAICQAGQITVENGLVDSHFGNVSYLKDKILHISQTGASLEEMEGCIDQCPLNGGSCAGITASSELSAHLKIAKQTGHQAILHGHPKFAVIMSLNCLEKCDKIEICHLNCTKERFIQDIPIVSGEIGTGKFGLCNTVPFAISNKRGVIVYGHGLFTTGKVDFKDAITNIFDIETMCINEFLRKI